MSFWRDERGATAIEYSLMVALLAIAILGSLSAFGEISQGKYDFIEQRVSGAIGGG